MNSDFTVRRNPAASRYETDIDGHLAVAEYLLEDDRVIFTHTFVPPELRGRGVAEKLVRTALEEARQEGRRVVPQPGIQIADGRLSQPDRAGGGQGNQPGARCL